MTWSDTRRIASRFSGSLEEPLKFASLLKDVCAQTPVQAAPPPEWTFDDVARTEVSQHPLVEAARDRITVARGTLQTAGSFANPVATYWKDNGAW